MNIGVTVGFSYFLDGKRDNWIGLEPGGHIQFLWQKVLWKVHDQILPTHRVHPRGHWK